MLNYKAGIASLMSILIVGSVVTISLGISSVFLGELRIARLANASFIANYASLAGFECAAFWHTNGGVILSMRISPFMSSLEQKSIICLDNDVNDPYLVPDDDPITPDRIDGCSNPTDCESNFRIYFNNGSCADVNVKTTSVDTTIISFGQNDCAPGASLVVQKGLRKKLPND
ncbi:hypothetical protein ACFL3E_00100 [Patescibacteria group bacterium]